MGGLRERAGEPQAFPRSAAQRLLEADPERRPRAVLGRFVGGAPAVQSVYPSVFQTHFGPEGGESTHL